MSHETMVCLIRAALDKDGFSQAEFCRLVGVSTKHLNQVLRGKAYAELRTLDRWAEALGREFRVKLVRR